MNKSSIVMISPSELEELKLLAKKMRIHVLNMVNYAQSSHIGACYSIIEILASLYLKTLNIDPKNTANPHRDKFLLSKAHGSCALYAVLAELGFFPLHYLDKYYIDGGILPGHLDKTTAPGIEHSMGSLGHGLPVGVGLAIANKKDNNPGRIFVLVGDGECNEGSIWEAVMLASHLKLDNLTVIVDYNKIQSFGRTNDVINQEPITERWSSFGWSVLEVDGHDFTQLINSLTTFHTKPKVIIAHTIKGKGVSFMENRLDWHYKSPNNEEYQKALLELENQN